MKVDVENCPACGAKNSKFVQQCYRCHAELPWSPNYKAPAPKPAASPAPAPAPTPGAPTPTVTLPPAPANSTSEPAPAGQPSASPSLPPVVAENLKKVPAKVEAPTWGLIAVGAGVLFLGMGIMAVMMNSRRQPTVIVAPTPVVSVQVTPIPGTTPAGTPAPGQTPVATGTAAPVNTPVPGGTPAPSVTSVPGETSVPAATAAPGATPGAVSTPAAVAPAGSPAPAEATPTPPAPLRLGPSFQDATAKLEKGTNSTQAQKQAYWKSIQGTQVSWTGEVVEADSNGGGKLSLRCAPDAKAADVQITLDGSQTAMLASLGKGKKVAVQGILQDHSSTGYVLTNGRITAQG